MVDKSWIHLSTRSCIEYINGVENFLEYAFKNPIDGDMKINCPCIDCSNRYRRTRDEVQYHRLFRGIRRDYTTWYLYGEGDSEEEGDSEVEGDDDDDGMLYGDMFDMIKDAYPQVVHGRESSGNEPQEPIGDAKKFYRLLEEVKRPLYPDCEKYSSLSFIVKLLHIRWQPNKGGKGKNKKVPWKVLRYFPLKSRLQRLFMSTKTATDMKWHHEKHVNDEVLRHPADCETWKKFDQIHESFAMDPRPKGPGNDIDVFLRPLIDELKELWEDGVCIYDASTKENLQMRAAVLWTIHDFPAYAKDYSHLQCVTFNFFKELCSKVLRVDDLDCLETQIAITLCKLEQIFPPSFFDVMVHLAIHLSWEAKVASLVQYRWLYPVERYLHKLTRYVRNMAHVEGSIAEKEHKNILTNASVLDNDRITNLYNTRQVDGHMLSLARGPEKMAIFYRGYNVNGFRFHINQCDESKRTQNNGVVVRGEDQRCYVPYYGQLTDIVELQYIEGNKVVSFKCNWCDVSREGIGYKRDWHGTTIVNTSRKLKTVKPYVLACQATQVYYVNGIKYPTWNVVIETKPRNIYEMPSNEEEPYQEEENLNCNANMLQEENEDDDIDWSRSGVENMIIK
ncbi:uncharacterized protein LOC142625386 [Castanea sativa]|uniref:uncharacterized protein LOC142625386 n=1 Tax=Castanea sativa TaxID=21020 RepID=UPI003F6506FE